MFDVRSSDLTLPQRVSPARRPASADPRDPASGANAAFSSNRVHARAGVQHELRDLVLGRWRRERDVDVESEVAAAASRRPP